MTNTKKKYDLQWAYDTVNYATNYVRGKNYEGSPVRSRLLSLAVTDLESAENWISRAIAELEESDEESNR